jgi:hypothetical protein
MNEKSIFGELRVKRFAQAIAAFTRATTRFSTAGVQLVSA